MSAWRDFAGDVAEDLCAGAGVAAALWSWVRMAPTCVVYVNRLPLGAQGMALPGLILLVRTHRWEQILRHELVHQDQMRRYSPFGVALFLGWHYARGFWQHGKVDRETFWALWAENPLEKEANAAMDQSAWERTGVANRVVVLNGKRPDPLCSWDFLTLKRHGQNGAQHA